MTLFVDSDNNDQNQYIYRLLLEKKEPNSSKFESIHSTQLNMTSGLS